MSRGLRASRNSWEREACFYGFQSFRVYGFRLFRRVNEHRFRQWSFSKVSDGRGRGVGDEIKPRLSILPVRACRRSAAGCGTAFTARCPRRRGAASRRSPPRLRPSPTSAHRATASGSAARPSPALWLAGSSRERLKAPRALRWNLRAGGSGAAWSAGRGTISACPPGVTRRWAP